MAVTEAQLQTSLAYRLGENSTPGDTNEVARRREYFNDALRAVYKDWYYWFFQDTGSLSTVSGQEKYTLPTTVRDILELRMNGKLVIPQSQPDSFGSYNYPPTYYVYSNIANRYFLYGDRDLHILPKPSVTPDTLTVSSITRSGTTATVTTSAAHGYSSLDFVTLAGATQTDYNGEFEIQSVPSTTTFTITVDNSPTTPATGTITVTQRNLVFRYYKKLTLLSSTSSTTDLPDEYAYGLVAFAYARKMQQKGKRGSTADGFDEFNEFLKDLRAEQNRRNFMNRSDTPTLPHYIVGL